MRFWAKGITLLEKKNAPTHKKAINIINERIIRKSEIPADFMANNSKFSPMLPNVIIEASKMANGKAKGIDFKAA